MSPDGITIHLLVEELKRSILQGRVDRVYQPEQLEAVLVIRKAGQNWRLLLSAAADNARLHLTRHEQANPPSPPLFCLVMRKHLEGGRLITIAQDGLDRIVRLTFSHLGESGAYQEIMLISEIMGKHSNLVLVERQSGEIIDAIKRYSHAVSRYREVLPGRIYIPPPGQEKVHPLQLDEEGLTRLLQRPLQEGGWENSLDDLLFRKIAGIGPHLAREILFRANLPPDLRLEECGAYEFRSLWQALQRIVLPLLRWTGDTPPDIYRPCLVLEGKRPICYAPVPLAQYDGLHLLESATLNEAADEFYASRTAQARFQQLQSTLAAIVRQQLARCGKKLALQQRSQAEADRDQDCRLQGEMLLAHLHLIAKGQTQAVLPNLYDPEAPPLTIELDPSLTPSQNARRLFHRYEKARDSMKIIGRHIAGTREEMAYLASVQTALEQAETGDELEEIAAELEEAGYKKARNRGRGSADRRSRDLTAGGRGGRDRKAAGSPKRLPPQVSRLVLGDGLEILFGRNNKQNDYLTMRLARKDDLWLHAKDAPGAHVVIRSQPGREIPDPVLEKAARLAAYYSDGRYAAKVPVDYTLRKNVWKPANARPGFVLYDNYRTILAAPEPPE
jgi:predicted ribosome quality control (RQC) complex YloA/Tae2 family protein